MDQPQHPSSNPYESPRDIPDALLSEDESSDEVFRLGKALVVPNCDSVELPNRCIACNRLVEQGRKIAIKKRDQTARMQDIVVIALSILFLIIATFFMPNAEIAWSMSPLLLLLCIGVCAYGRQQIVNMSVTYGVCDQHRLLNGVGVALVWIGIVLYLISAFAISVHSFTAIILLFVLTTIQSRLVTVLKFQAVEGRFVRLRGASRKFLESLPDRGP